MEERDENETLSQLNAVWIRYNPKAGREADAARFSAAIKEANENPDSPIRKKLAEAGRTLKSVGLTEHDNTIRSQDVRADGKPLAFGEIYPHDDQKAQRLQQLCEDLRQMYAIVMGDTVDFPYTFSIETNKKEEELFAQAQQKLNEITAVLNNPNAPKIVPKTASPAAASPAATIGAKSEAGPEIPAGFHRFLDLHREHVNARLASTNFTLEGHTLKHKTSGHKLDIADNGTMRAQQIEFKDDPKIEQKLFEDLQAMLKTYSALADKNCPMSAPLHLSLYEDGNLSAEQKKQFAAMKTRIGHRIAEELQNPEYTNIRNLVRYEGKIPTVAPAPAVAPVAPPPRPLADHERTNALKSTLSEIMVIEGKITDAAKYGESLPGVDPKTTAFIFPGNDRHADKGLHDAKSGTGLAKVASFLGEAGIGTLSLPTTFYNGTPTQDSAEKLAHSEMAKLWEAAGRGFTLVLPVREATDFFNNDQRNAVQNITGNNTREPSFWGGEQKELAAGTENFPKIYTEELGKLQKFIKDWNASPSNRSKMLNDLKDKNPDFHRAFENGLRIKMEDQAKLAPKAAAPAAKAAESPSTPKK